MSWFKDFFNRANQESPEVVAKKWMDENPQAVADYITQKEREHLDSMAQEAVNNLPVQNVEIKQEDKIDLDKLNDEIAGN